MLQRLFLFSCWLRWRHRLGVAVAGWLGVIVAIAQEPPPTPDDLGQPVVETFSVRDYDADPQTWASATDEAGLVYVGNKGCVLEYDGAAWRRIPIGNTIFVRALARAADGRIYVGGVDELGYLAADAFGRKRFVSLRDRLPPEDRALGAVWTIKTGEGGVYFGAGPRVLRWHDERFEVWRDPDPQVFQRLGGEDGAVFVKITGRPLERLTGSRREVVSRDPRLLPVALVAAWPRGEDVMLVSASDGLWRVRPDGSAEPWLTEIESTLREPSAVLTAAPLPGGGVALGMMHRGLIELDAAGRFVRRLGREEGVPNPLVRVGVHDRAGGLWLGTNHGVARVFLDGPRTFFGAGQGLAGARVNAVARHRGELHFATGGGLLRLRPREAASLSNARLELLPAIAAQNIFALGSAPTGLLLAENDRLVFLRDGGARPETLLPSPTVLDLAASTAEKNVWWGASGSGGGLSRIAWVEGAWRVERPYAGLQENFHSVAEDAHGDLWLATALRGVWRVEFGVAPEPGAARPVARVTHFSAGHGLPAPLGAVVVVVRDGEPVFSVGSERWRFNRAAGQPERDPAPAGIADAWLAALGGARPHAQNARWDRGVWWLGGAEVLERFDPARESPRLPAIAVLRGVSAQPNRLWPSDGQLGPETRQLTFEFTALPTRHPAQLQTRLAGFDDAWSEPGATRVRTYTNLPAGDYRFAVRARDGAEAWGPETTLAFTLRPAWWATWPARAGAVLLLAAGIAGLVRVRGQALRRRNEELQTIVATRTAELQAARDAADAANAAKSNFLAQMSHELRTPLNGILAYAQLLRREPALPAEQRARAAVIVRSGEHLLGLINDVLDLAKVEAGRDALQETETDLRALVAGAAELTRARAESKGLAFRVDCDEALPPGVRTDERKLRQVLLNLLGNAVKFTARGEVVLVVHAVTPGGTSRPPFGSRAPFGLATVAFVVSDTGPGLSPEQRAQPFRPFGVTTANPHAGSGLGLALSQRFVELLGGELRVTNVDGGGARFFFELAMPIAPRPSRADDAVSFVTGYAGPRRHALVVDDDVTSRQALAEMLAAVGFSVDTAADGAAAETRWQARPADLVLLDLRLADGESGAEVARRLRVRAGGAAARFVAVSASAYPEDQHEAQAAGCGEFLAKPFTETSLWTAVGRILDLTWEMGRPTPVSPDHTRGQLPAALTETLRALAGQGDVTGLRDALEAARREHPAQAAFLGGLQQLAATYDLERVSARLRAAPETRHE